MDYQNQQQHNFFDSINDSSSRDSSLEPGDGAAPMQKSLKKLEKRRESSRYAARDRRGKEADIFVDLKDVVPIVDESTVTHVDRIALLRVASTMCRMRRNAAKFLATELPPEDPFVQAFTEQNLTECLDGFLLLADSDGTILYVSESVSLFLGLTQTDLVGRFLNEFVHGDDYDELIRWSTTDCDVEEASTLDDFGRYLVVRMKSVISPRGRTLNLKSALYKAILCRFRAVTTEYGRLSLLYGSSTPAGQGNTLMLSNSAVKGAETTSGVYMTRHTCDMRFSYVSDSLNFLLRHDSRSLMGSSFYELVHPSDVSAVAQSFHELFRKSHCRTPFYRLLGANGSVAWAQTEATTVNHTARGQKGQYVLCVHSIVGMQSEAESWAEPIVDSIGAANPAFCASRIKREVPDMAEYMGRQPEFIECVDFTPLIDPINDVNLNDFNPVRIPAKNGRAGGNERNPRAALIEDADSPSAAKQRRKKSFDDVLNWLVRDEADSPPPPFNNNSGVTNGDDLLYPLDGEGIGLDDDDATDPNLAAAAAFYNSNSFRDSRQQAADASDERAQFADTQQGARRVAASGVRARGVAASKRPPPQRQFFDGAGGVDAKWPRDADRLVPFDGGDASVAERKATPVARAPHAAATAAPLAQRAGDRGGAARAVPCGGGAIERPAERFSRYDAHKQMQQRAGAVGGKRDDGAAVANERSSGPPRTISALPAADCNPVSTPNVRDAGRPILYGGGGGGANGPATNPAMYTAVRASGAALASAGSRASSRASSCGGGGATDEMGGSAGSGVQFVGEFYSRPMGSNRSRSGSSTASGYAASASRRYGSAQASPSPRPISRNVGRRASQPREQRPVNVNQLGAAPLSIHTPPLNYNNNQQQQQQNNQYAPNYAYIDQQNSGNLFTNSTQPSNPPPNFYYAARNPANAVYYNQQQPLCYNIRNPVMNATNNMAADKRHSMYEQQQQSSMPTTMPNMGNDGGYAPIPAKRMAYGEAEPTSECPPLDKNYCSDLSRLAPFVPEDDMLQLEDLDFQNLFPEVDLREFFV